VPGRQPHEKAVRRSARAAFFLVLMNALADSKAEAASLVLLRVKRGLLGSHPLDQLLDPIKHRLIRDAGGHNQVMFDLLIELDALFTH
jgi:hypothetical protein